MTHWGWYWRVSLEHITRTEYSSLPKIDSFKLFKNFETTSFTVEPFDIKAT